MNQVLPCITLHQPWAIWIMRGWKTIETRTHTRFKSLSGKYILIHAGQSTDSSNLTMCNPYLTKEQILYNPDEVVNGFILGCVHVYGFGALDDRYSKRALIDCKTTLRYGLFLQDINLFAEPIPVKGELGIWYFDTENNVKVTKPTVQYNLFNSP